MNGVIISQNQGFGHSGFFGVQSTLQSANLNLVNFWHSKIFGVRNDALQTALWTKLWIGVQNPTSHSTPHSNLLSTPLFATSARFATPTDPERFATTECNPECRVQSGVLTTPTERRLLSAAFTLQPSWNDLTLRTPPGGVKFLSALQNWPIFRSATPKRPVYMRDYSPNCLIS